MDKYAYDGPVRMYENILTTHWKAETVAESEAKARSNLAYQYKKTHGLDRSTKITLTGKIERI